MRRLPKVVKPDTRHAVSATSLRNAPCADEVRHGRSGSRPGHSHRNGAPPPAAPTTACEVLPDRQPGLEGRLQFSGGTRPGPRRRWRHAPNAAEDRSRSRTDHGFAAATSVNRAGNSTEPTARAMTTRPSSSGWRSPSTASRRNSVNSSRNRTPWCQSVRECTPRPSGGAASSRVAGSIERSAGA